MLVIARYRDTQERRAFDRRTASLGLAAQYELRTLARSETLRTSPAQVRFITMPSR